MGSKKARKARQKKAAGRVRLNKESVYVFKKAPDGIEKAIPPRGIAIMNAIQKLERGTAKQVAARVIKSDYDGKQDLEGHLAPYYLRRLYNLGAVTVEQPAD